VTADKWIYCWIDRVIICSCIYLYILFNLNNNDKLHVLYFGSLFSFTSKKVSATSGWDHLSWKIYKRVHGKLFYLIFLDISRHVLKIRECYSLPIWKCKLFLLSVVKNSQNWRRNHFSPVKQRFQSYLKWHIFLNGCYISYVMCRSGLYTLK
jgi:hypothetical protein